MTGRIPARVARLLGAVFAVSAVLAVTAGAASASEVVYNNILNPKPGNVASEAFQATSTSQFGGTVELAGTARKAGTVTVGMSSWACQTGSWTGPSECVTTKGAKFAWPITLKVYEVGPGNAVGAPLTSLTQTFNMPYRPSQNNKKCTGESKGAWYSQREKACFHGLFFTIKYKIPKGFTWPSKAIVSVEYNTSDHGAEPQRPKPCNSETAGCPYDSLNVGLTEESEKSLSVGTDPQPNDAYQNSTVAGFYCDGGAGGTGVFRLDAGCWAPYQPTFTITAK